MRRLRVSPHQQSARVSTQQVDGRAQAVCEVDGLTIAYRHASVWLRAVRELSFRLETAETLAIVGETGSGKSSTAYAVLNMLPPGGRILGGDITVDDVNIRRLDERELRRLRGKTISYVPQEPSASFNPTMTIGRQIAEPLAVHEGIRYRDALPLVRETLTEVGLTDTQRVIDAFPHQLSGGMLQRAMLASAIITRPLMLIADEPTSALDVTVQRQILALLRRVRDEHQLSILLISHDLGTVSRIADKVMVLYAGRKVEFGDSQTLLAAPRHPYTRALIESSPGRGQPHKSQLVALTGAPLGPAEVDAAVGCPFVTRCPRAFPECAEHFPAETGTADHNWHCFNPEPPV